MMNRSGYDISSGGTIQNPGKFESEMWYVPELWNKVLEGYSNETHYDSLDTPYDVFIVNSEDRTLYDLSPDVHALVLHEDDNGFVYCDHLDKAEYEEFLESLYSEDDPDLY